MIRLVVFGDETACLAAAKRLRGAVVECCLDASCLVVPPAGEAVLLVEPHPQAAEVIQSCLAAGKHVLAVVQRELASAALQNLSALARKKRVQLAIVNPDRFLASRRLIRQQLDSGKLGEPGLVRMHRWEAAECRGDRDRLILPEGLLRDLDLAVWLAGKSPQLVYAVEHLPEKRGTPGGRVLHVHLGFAGGAMALVDYAGCLPAGDGYRSLSVIASTGAAYADDHHNMQLLYRGDRPQGLPADERAPQLAALMQNFVDDLSAARDLSGSVAEWERVLKIADAAVQSLETRRAVSLEER